MYTVNVQVLREMCDSVILLPVVGFGIAALTVVFVALETLSVMKEVDRETRSMRRNRR